MYFAAISLERTPRKSWVSGDCRAEPLRRRRQRALMNWRGCTLVGAGQAATTTGFGQEMPRCMLIYCSKELWLVVLECRRSELQCHR